jgi:hypothetical protein
LEASVEVIMVGTMVKDLGVTLEVIQEATQAGIREGIQEVIREGIQEAILAGTLEEIQEAILAGTREETQVGVILVSQRCGDARGVRFDTSIVGGGDGGS